MKNNPSVQSLQNLKPEAIAETVMYGERNAPYLLAVGLGSGYENDPQMENYTRLNIMLPTGDYISLFNNFSKRIKEHNTDPLSFFAIDPSPYKTSGVPQLVVGFKKTIPNHRISVQSKGLNAYLHGQGFTNAIIEQVMASNVRWGMSAYQGERDTMEDAYAEYHTSDRFFFGIYDGHGGSEAADTAAKYLHHKIIDADTGDTDEQKIVNGFIATDLQIRAEHGTKNVGTCAITAYINKFNLYIAWAGDSRAIVVRNGEIICETVDHKPNNPKEQKRIKDADGWISSWGTPRVAGLLSVARALGGNTPWVIPNPDFYHSQICEGDILILACDGIWDVMSSQDAASIVENVLKKSNTELEKQYPVPTKEEIFFGEQGNDRRYQLAARALWQEAYNKKSNDNLTVGIIAFGQTTIRDKIGS